MRPPRSYLLDTQSLTIDEWSAISGIPKKTIRTRLDRGWGLRKAIYWPINGNPFGTDWDDEDKWANEAVGCHSEPLKASGKWAIRKYNKHQKHKPYIPKYEPLTTQERLDKLFSDLS